MDIQDALIREYEALRTEICQTVAKQNKILLTGYALTAAVFGYIIGAPGVDLRSAAVLPVALIVMVSLWAAYSGERGHLVHSMQPPYRSKATHLVYGFISGWIKY